MTPLRAACRRAEREAFIAKCKMPRQPACIVHGWRAALTAAPGYETWRQKAGAGAGACLPGLRPTVVLLLRSCSVS